MSKFFFLFSLILFIHPSKGFSQHAEFPEIGKYSDEELTMTECSFDKDADAVILLDAAIVNYDDDYHMVTDHRVRIKILNERGFKWSNVSIPFYSKDKFERIFSIEGLTYNYNGFGQATEIIHLEKKQVFTEKVNDLYSRIVFAMPGVKKGSIIEYKYTSVMESYGGLRNWMFQTSAPTIKSFYDLTIIPNVQFTYLVTKNQSFPIKIVPNRAGGGIYFEMNNLPGLIDEPYMNALKDYKQRVEFQLTGIKNMFGDTKSMNETWFQIAKSLDEDKDLGSAMRKDLPGMDAIKSLLTDETTATQKIKKLYNYIQTNFAWDNYDSRYATDGLKKIMEKKVGTSGDLNLLLVNLLQLNDIEAYPLLVADRGYGNVDPKNPILNRFNKVAAYAIADGKTFILDVTEKYCPAELIPYSLLNTYALIINRNTREVIRITSGVQSYSSNIRVTSALDKDGVLNGTSIIRNTGYARPYYAQLIKEDNNRTFIKKNLEEANQDISVSNFSYTGSENDADSLLFNFNFKKDYNSTGGFVLLNYNLFAGQGKNPFTREYRFTDINFGYTFSIFCEHEIELPKGASVPDPLPDKTIETPKKEMTVSRLISVEGNKLNIKLIFRSTKSLFGVIEYEMLREFFSRMTLLLNEPLPIKLN